jgi:hypothetical protein
MLTLNWLFFILGEELKKLETEKGIIIRFVIGHRYVYSKGIWLFSSSVLTVWQYICLAWLIFFVFDSASPGGVLDRAIEAEDDQHKDFLRLVCYG